jgi:hypothetical protein
MSFSKVLGLLAVVIAILCMINGDAIYAFIVMMLALQNNKLDKQPKTD